MGLFGLVFRVVGAIVLLVIGLGAYLYFTDYAAQAAVTDRSAACPDGLIEVTPKIAPFVKHQVALDCDVWQVVCTGYDVTYHLQTRRTIVTEDGRVIYDTGTGEKDLVGLARCGASNSGAGLL